MIYAWVLRRWPMLLALGIALLALGWTGHWLYQRGGDAARADCMEARNKMLESALGEIAKAEAERDRLAKHLAEALNRPKAAPVIREVVRANPSNCDLRPETANVLRNAIRAANNR